jgi:hypothetical protein
MFACHINSNMHEGVVKKNSGEMTSILTVDDDIDSLRVIGRSLECARSKSILFQIHL